MFININKIDKLPRSIEHALKALEFEKVRHWLRERCASTLGQEIVDSLHPYDDIEKIEFSLNFISEIKRLLTEYSNPDLSKLKDIRRICVFIFKEGIASSEQIWHVKEFIDIITELKQFSDKLGKGEFPLFKKFADGLQALEPLARSVGKYLKEPGHIKYNATALLKRLNDQHGEIHNSIHSKLNNFISSKRYKKFLQEEVITLREGRFVLPVKSAWQSKVDGIVHDRSSTGATVFIEPLEITKLNNKLKEIGTEREEEMQRILRGLTRTVSAKLNNLFWDIKQLKKLDFYQSAASLSLYMNSAPPHINSDGRLNILQGTHPLLIEEQKGKGSNFEAVPINFDVGQDSKVLILTGPNMGGKTVTLKTVGLLSLMALTGLHIPASPDTEIPLFKKIFVDIGDEQSIEFSLSSFAAHLRRWKNALDDADKDSLVLLDELGSSTAPEEGAPLALSLLKILSDKGCLIIAATHLGTVKAFAEETADFENASMEFDEETLRPTYHVNIGSPGRSWAFEVAKKLGLPQGLIDGAYNYLSSDEIKLESLTKELQHHLKRLKAKENELNQRLERVSITETEIDTLRAEIAADRESLKKERRRYEIKKNEMLEKFLEKTKKELKIKLDKSSECLEKINSEQEQEQTLNEIDKQLLELRESRDDESPHPMELVEGEEVLIVTLNKEGTIIKPPDKQGRMKVLIGGKSLDIHFSKVEVLDKSEDEKQVSKARYEIVKPADKVNVLGKTFEDAKRIISHTIDNAIAADMESLEIIHGEKVLYKKLREFFTNSDRIEAYRPGEPWQGANNITIIKLKQSKSKR